MDTGPFPASFHQRSQQIQRSSCLRDRISLPGRHFSVAMSEMPRDIVNEDRKGTKSHWRDKSSSSRCHTARKNPSQSKLHGGCYKWVSAPSKTSPPDACMMNPPPLLPSLEYCCPGAGQLTFLCRSICALQLPSHFFPNWKMLSHSSLFFSRVAFKPKPTRTGYGVENSNSYCFFFVLLLSLWNQLPCWGHHLPS